MNLASSAIVAIVGLGAIVAIATRYEPTAIDANNGCPAISVDQGKEPFLDGERSVGDLMPVSEGLTELLRAGAIRPASNRDLAALECVLDADSPFSLLASEDSRAYPGMTFVVLRAATVPRDMYGADSRTFIIPPGVPQPVDSGSHNVYYRMLDGSCLGVACPR